MKNKMNILNWIFGGLSFGKLRVWPWKAEFWRLRCGRNDADIRA